MGKFKIEVNDEGQVLLSPEGTVPAREAWLYRNADAHAAVRRGMEEAERVTIVRRGSFAANESDDRE